MSEEVLLSAFRTGSSSGSGFSSSTGSKISSSDSSGLGSFVTGSFAFVIIMLIVYAALAGLHIWRFTQTRTKYHGVLAGALLLQIIASILLIAVSSEPAVVLASFPVALFGAWVTLSVPSIMLARWGRSMQKVIGQHGATTFRVGVSWIGLFGVGILVGVAGFILLIVVIATFSSASTSRSTSSLMSSAQSALDNIEIAQALFKAGYGIVIVGCLLLAGYCVWLLSVTPDSNGSQGIAAKRRQLIVLISMFSMLFIANLSDVLVFPYTSFIAYIIFYSVGLYPRLVLTGYSGEPDLTVQMAAAAGPSVVYVQQPVAGMPGQPGVVYAAVPAGNGMPGQPGVVYTQAPMTTAAAAPMGSVYAQPIAYQQPLPQTHPHNVMYSQATAGQQYREVVTTTETAVVNETGTLPLPGSMAGVPSDVSMPMPSSGAAMESIPINSGQPTVTPAPYPQQ